MDHCASLSASFVVVGLPDIHVIAHCGPSFCLNSVTERRTSAFPTAVRRSFSVPSLAFFGGRVVRVPEGLLSNFSLSPLFGGHSHAGVTEARLVL
ncbi:hypothetical protein HPB52_015630 [Rhipicephalus sanguineus]|uniref:Uncharacterized protein n=1 Tax=Rhipicephalus sanguineus TaxID=34632 RepID=A0A9D4Q6W7_RHISA|nr:hypothetical protein HPB52_015630 [Rhipicephalus sanguineus]